ncbi:MAG: hypothetical protein K2Q26_12295 [Bdellovibrionales bacterium]|nr:hypothetical protein [Bdellovibrionales bacterium]
MLDKYSLLEYKLVSTANLPVELMNNDYKMCDIRTMENKPMYYGSLVETNFYTGKIYIFSHFIDTIPRNWTDTKDRKDIMNNTANLKLIKMTNQYEHSERIKLLYELLPQMDDERVVAIYLRFWESLTIAEIAKTLGKSWIYTNELIESSLLKLRGEIQKINKQVQLTVA